MIAPLLSSLLLLLPLPRLAEAKAQAQAQALEWHDLSGAAIEGRGWSETEAPYDRLPARARELVRPPVWGLSRDSAGICARFVTDATSIRARWSLISAELAMPHMPATGVSGLDLYGRDGEGRWRWVGAGRPSGQESETTLAAGLDGAEREYLLYLPLYNGVTSVELGLPESASFRPGPGRPEGRRSPIVFYGTSITQGGCASRPGMTHVAQLGRWLDRPVINLGFSGNGRMDLEVATLLGELEAAVFVVDCLPNMSGAQVEERCVPFVRELRRGAPGTPVLLVGDRTFADAPFRAGRRAGHEARRSSLEAGLGQLREAGMEGLHHLEGSGLLGLDGEDTVDGSHPTDLGFLRQARSFHPLLLELLEL